MAFRERRKTIITNNEITNYLNENTRELYWASSNGRTTKIKDLDVNHMLNILKKQQRDGFYGINEVSIFKYIQKELKYRETIELKQTVNNETR